MKLPAFSFLTAGRVIFGRSTCDQVTSELRACGRRIMLVRGRSVAWADQLEADLNGSGALCATAISAGEPTIDDVQQALVMGRAAKVDAVVAVGGGAVIDLGKAIAALLPASGTILDHLEGVGGAKPLEHDPLPFVAMPTTSGTGAEVTKNAVITVPDAGRKVSLRDDRMLPDVAIIDPALTDNLPRAQTLASGLDALTQVIEPYLSTRANPLTDALCRDAIPRGAYALARLAAGDDAQARDEMAFVSLAGGLALANAGLGAVHGLAGVLGGRLGAPHGLVCGRLLGPVLSANAEHLVQEGKETTRFDEVADWLGSAFGIDRSDVFHGLPDLLDQWRVPRLDQWIAGDVDLDAIAEEAAKASSMKSNPCALSSSHLVGAMRQTL
ncbi:iron-containing alcohol dehydrogenase [uncultured Roseobacter sp.]|uniref:iron-containing alcohol dehydrogenase n=1 Tax=uncultured Roseobacter sp. TaxID=114847 RepID=UPI0026183870|nr:iron-containing alcohol dehydrogenase [uncultured Roseobacter sp.]